MAGLFLRSRRANAGHGAEGTWLDFRQRRRRVYGLGFSCLCRDGLLRPSANDQTPTNNVPAPNTQIEPHALHQIILGFVVATKNGG